MKNIIEAWFIAIITTMLVFIMILIILNSNNYHPLIITGTSNDIKLIDGELCKKYYLSNNKEYWILSSEEWSIGDTIKH